VQNVNFNSFGSVAYNEWSWFTSNPPAEEEMGTGNDPRVPREAAQTSWPWFAAPPKSRRRGRRSPKARIEEDDIITTLNLPLLAVLRNIDEFPTLQKEAAHVLVQQYLELPKLDGQFEGLFMRRCAFGGCFPFPYCH
jgi:hypothetical protein